MSTVVTSDATPASTVIVLGEDRRAADAVRLAFERAGVLVVVIDQLAPEAIDASIGLIVASATAAGAAQAALAQAVQARGGGGRDVPVLYVGNGITRREAVSVGADEVIGRPAFARDVVTIGRLLAGQPAATRGHWVGQIEQTVGVYYLVRALTALGRSGVLTLSRGLRRGEVRFFLGELTSAQVGGLHGQAALHQLLLWTDGRFDFRREDVVRRRQIPLPTDELFADAERFLVSVREASGGLSPAMVLEQDPRQMLELARTAPKEIHGVLRMFDGNRTLADVIEDSPYRVFETMRVVSTALAAGILRRVHVERPRTKFRAVLALEEWLAGGSKDAAVERAATLADSGAALPVAPALAQVALPIAPSGKRKRRKRATSRPGAGPGFAPDVAPVPAVAPVAPAVVASSIDWGALVPRGVAVEMQGLSQVVPSSQVSGEIAFPRELNDAAPATRKVTREGLEALTSSEARDQMFPSAPRGAPPSEPPPSPVPTIAVPTVGAEAVPQPITSTGLTPRGLRVPDQTRAPDAPVADAPSAGDTDVTMPVRTVTAETAALAEAEAWAAVEREAAARLAAEEAAAAAAARARNALGRAATESDPALAAPREAAEHRVRAEIQSEADVRIAAAVAAVDRISGDPGELDLTPVTDPPIAPVTLPRSPDLADPEERAEVARATARARDVAARGRDEAFAAERALADAERVHAMAEQLSAAADAAEARHVAAAQARSDALSRANPPLANERPLANEPTILVDDDLRHQAAPADPHFHDHEEEFFETGASPTYGHPPEPHDSFHDLDAGYQPVGFWDRLLGRDKHGRRRKPR